MKNPFILKVLLLVVVCLPAYGHNVYNEYYIIEEIDTTKAVPHEYDKICDIDSVVEEHSCEYATRGRICDIPDAIEEVQRIYGSILVIRVRYYSNRGYMRVTFIDKNGERQVKLIYFDCNG